MKATMDESGVITLSPETEVEAFALRVWAHRASVDQPGGLAEPTLWRATHLKVDATLPSRRAVRKYRENCDD